MNLASLSRGAACPCQLTRGGASGPRQAAPPSLCVHRSAVRGRQLQWARRWLPRSLRSDNRAVCSSSGTPAGENWIQKNKRSATLVAEKLRAYGLAGVLSYGLLNTAYYSIAFLVVWTTVIKAPTGLGVNATARKFLETFAIVWAGSQVTKAFRAGGALLMAPVVDTLIGRVQLWLDARKGVRGGSSGSSGDALLGGGGTGDGGGKGTSREQAFTVVVFACVAFALLLFGGVVVLWAY